MRETTSTEAMVYAFAKGANLNNLQISLLIQEGYLVANTPNNFAGGIASGGNAGFQLTAKGMAVALDFAGGPTDG